MSEGEELGKVDGDFDGTVDDEGKILGVALGMSEGEELGTALGINEGEKLGTVLGVGLGTELFEGTNDGGEDGDIDGKSECAL